MSNTIVDNYLSEQLALLETQTTASVATGTYGADLSCIDGLTPTMKMVTGDGVEIIKQSLIRRLNSPRGSLYSDQEYGTDLSGYLNKAMTAAEVTELEGSIQAECRKDDRVESCSATVTLETSSLTILIHVSPVDPSLEDFDLTFILSTDTLELV